jgi:hypothetical protein
MVETKANRSQFDVLLLLAEPEDATSISATRACGVNESSISAVPTSISLTFNPIACDQAL